MDLYRFLNGCWVFKNPYKSILRSGKNQYIHKKSGLIRNIKNRGGPVIGEFTVELIKQYIILIGLL